MALGSRGSSTVFSRFSAIVLLFLAHGLAGCGGSGSPSTPSAVSTGSVSRISGFVLDTGFRPIAEARVEVVDGPGAGAATATDADGRFSLTGTFDSSTRFRATKEGHVAATQAWSCAGSCPGGGQPWLGFYLAVLAPNADIAGNYNLTLIADGACPDLPNEVRTRHYAATIKPRSSPDLPANAGFVVTLSGATFLDGLDSFGIGVAGDYLGIWLAGGHNPSFVEQVTADTYLAFSGSAAASVSASGASTISAPLEGWIEYYGTTVVRARCESRGHQLILTRR
jgi:hypothetical protein